MMSRGRVLVYSEGLFGIRPSEGEMRSSRRAPIGRSNLQAKGASAETCGLFLKSRPRAASATNVHSLVLARAQRFPVQTQVEGKKNTSGARKLAGYTEKETLFDSHSSPPTHLQPRFTQVCKCSFLLSFYLRVWERERKTKTERVEPGRRGSWDRDGDGRKTKRIQDLFGSLESP